MNHRLRIGRRAQLPPAAALITVLLAAPLAAQAPDVLPFERTEKVATCPDYDPLKQPFFGETHVHTGRSFDASINLVPATPRDAYRFAKGESDMPGSTAWAWWIPPNTKRSIRRSTGVPSPTIRSISAPSASARITRKSPRLLLPGLPAAARLLLPAPERRPRRHRAATRLPKKFRPQHLLPARHPGPRPGEPEHPAAGLQRSGLRPSRARRLGRNAAGRPGRLRALLVHLLRRLRGDLGLGRHHLAPQRPLPQRQRPPPPGDSRSTWRARPIPIPRRFRPFSRRPGSRKALGRPAREMSADERGDRPERRALRCAHHSAQLEPGRRGLSERRDGRAAGIFRPADRRVRQEAP